MAGRAPGGAAELAALVFSLCGLVQRVAAEAPGAENTEDRTQTCQNPIFPGS